jgi:hypothetical protein
VCTPHCISPKLLADPFATVGVEMRRRAGLATRRHKPPPQSDKYEACGRPPLCAGQVAATARLGGLQVGDLNI